MDRKSVKLMGKDGTETYELAMSTDTLVQARSRSLGVTGAVADPIHSFYRGVATTTFAFFGQTIFYLSESNCFISLFP